MFDVEIILVVCSLDYKTGEYYFLSLDDDKISIPQTKLSENSTIEDTVSSLFLSSCLYDIQWSSTKLIKCMNDNKTLKIIYMSKIPNININNRFWIKSKSGSIIYPFIKDCMIYV